MVTIGIKTKESLHTIKSLDRAEDLTKKMKNGGSSVYDEASRQVSDDDSELDYGDSQLENWTESGSMMSVRTADRFGRWGIRTTTRNIRNRRIKKGATQNVKSNRQKLLNAPKKTQQKLLNAPKTTEKAAKTAEKTAKASAKAANKAAQAVKAVAKATVKGIKVAVKAVIAAAKAAVAAIKGIVAAIAAGGWVAVVIIIVICMVALIVGSVFAIFLPGDDKQEMTLQTVLYDLNREYDRKIGKLQSNYTYDYCVFDGEKASLRDVIAVYAVKVNADPQKPDEVFSMTDKKAKILIDVFWTVNKLSAYTEEKTETETHYETDSEGKTVKKQVEVKKVYLHVVSETITPYEAASHFGFSNKQYKTLAELLDPYCDEMWAAVVQ